MVLAPIGGCAKGEAGRGRGVATGVGIATLPSLGRCPPLTRVSIILLLMVRPILRMRFIVRLPAPSCMRPVSSFASLICSVWPSSHMPP